MFIKYEYSNQGSTRVVIFEVQIQNLFCSLFLYDFLPKVFKTLFNNSLNEFEMILKLENPYWYDIVLLNFHALHKQKEFMYVSDPKSNRWGSNW